jgi:cyclase
MSKGSKKRFSVCFGLIIVASAAAAVQQAQTQAQPAQPAQYRQEPAPVTLEKIAGNIYQVKGGSGANGGVFIGEKEILVIDAKMSADSIKQMIAEIQKISTNPIGIVALTHSDGDHVNGLTGFPAGVKVIAHQKTRRDMDEAFTEDALRAYLPQITFFDKLNLYFGPRRVEMLYFGPAHTSGDAVVYFPEEKTVFLGDLLFVGRDPLIHRHKNGNSFGLVKVLRAVLALDAEIFLSGHAERATRADVEAMIKSLEEKQAQIRAMINEGRSLEEIKKFYKIEDRPAQPGRPRFLSLPEVIYLELTE